MMGRDGMDDMGCVFGKRKGIGICEGLRDGTTHVSREPSHTADLPCEAEKDAWESRFIDQKSPFLTGSSPQTGACV